MTFHGRQLGAVISNIHVRIFNVLPDQLVGGNIFRKSSKLKIKVEDRYIFSVITLAFVLLEDRLKNVDFINSMFLSLAGEFLISSIFLISLIFLGRSGREGFSR